MKKIIIFLFTLLTFTLSAQTNVITNTDQEINHHLFNGDWEKSDSLIDLELAIQTSSLKFNFFKAYNYFYTRYVGNNNPYTRDETIRQVKKYSWQAVLNGEELIESLENNFYLGSAYALLSRVNIMNQEFWEGYWNASNAENYFEDVLDEDPDFADAYFNLGVNEYFPAVTITGFQSVLAWLGGMSGDREDGISKMEITSEKGKLFKDEANYALGVIYGFRENNLETAYGYWNKLSQKYPGNNNFAAQKSRAYFGKLVEDRGVKFLEDEFDNLETVYGVTNPNVLNTLGYTFLNQHKLDDALVVFKVNLKKYPELANCYDSLAECYLTRGENENAIKYYKLAFEKLETDTTITDEFRQFLEEGIRNNLEELDSRI